MLHDREEDRVAGRIAAPGARYRRFSVVPISENGRWHLSATEFAPI